MPFEDHPLPADFNVVPIVPAKAKVMPRKPKGAVAKITRDVKAGILEGAISHGSDGEGTGGLTGYFQMCASRYPKHYMNLLGRLVPVQVHGDGLDRPTPVAINIVAVPHDHYLSAADIAKLNNQPLEPPEYYQPPSGPLQIAQPKPDPKQAALEAKLANLTTEELAVLTKLLDEDEGR